MRGISFIVIGTLAACGGGGGSTDIEGTLVFAERTDVEISRLINAAGGTDMFGAMSQVEQFGDSFDDDPCPVIAIDGDTVTITGGCTRLDGLEVQGTATITNPSGFDEIDFDYNSDIVYELDDLRLIQGSVTSIYDGTAVRTDGLATWDADLTVSQFDIAIRSDIYYHCSNPNNPHCNLSGSGIEMIGVGGATASGEVTIDADTGTQESSFTLKGVDTLTVEIRSGCLGWSISGTDRGTDCPST